MAYYYTGEMVGDFRLWNDETGHAGIRIRENHNELPLCIIRSDSGEYWLCGIGEQSIDYTGEFYDGTTQGVITPTQGRFNVQLWANTDADGDIQYRQITSQVTGVRVQYYDRGFTTNLPIYEQSQVDTDDFKKYVEDGDDSGASNYEDLHGKKYHLYLTNDGDLISLRFTYDGDDIGSLDALNITVEDDFGNTTTYSGTLGWSRTWSAIIGDSPLGNKVARTLTLTFDGVGSSGQHLFTLQGRATREILFGLVGSVTCTAIIAEDNGHTLDCTTSGEFDDITTPTTPSSDAELPSGDSANYGGFTSLLTTYKLTKAQLHSLGDFIWNNSIFDSIKNLNNSPIENIVSCKYVPCSIGGSDATIKLGNVDTAVGGVLCSKNITKRDIGTFSIPRYCVGFLNTNGFTKVNLYLPLVGMIELNANDTVGHTIKVSYTFDIVCGTFGAYVYTDKGGGQTLIYSATGSCGIDIPLTASNRSAIESAIIGTAVDGALAVATGGITLGGVVSDIGSVATLQNHSSTFGSPSSMLSALNPSKCYVIVRYPIVSLASNFAHTHGYMCMQTFKLKDLKGYTQCDRVDLSGIIAYDDEIEEIRGLLEGGFYA